MQRNKDLFYRIAERIEKEPTTYFQGRWATLFMGDDNPFYWLPYIEAAQDQVVGDSDERITYSAKAAQELSCGTAYCIAGHVLIEAGWSTVWVPTFPISDPTHHYHLAWVDPAGAQRHPAYEIIAGTNLGIYDPETHEFELDDDDCSLSEIFAGEWEPREGLTVPQALRMLGDGASYYVVSGGSDDDEGDDV